MLKKEGARELVSNFEINKDKDTILFFIDTKIFPLSLIKKTAATYSEKAWVSIDTDSSNEVLIEMKLKEKENLEKVGREFNNALLNDSTKEIKVDGSDKNLVNQLKSVVSQFVREQEGRVSKQSVIAIGALLAGMGIGAESASASHTCPVYSGGTTGCCFPAGTKITMEDGSRKNIEEVKVGDIVLSFDTKNGCHTPAQVQALEKPIRDQYFIINNSLLKVTNDHPIFTKKKNGTQGWAAINPEASKKEYKIRPILKLEKGDCIFTSNVHESNGLLYITKAWIEIDTLECISSDVQTYSLKHVEPFNTFFADSVLVHNKEGCCFSANASVLTASGIKNIQDIRIGTEVISFDKNTKKLTTSTVGEIHRHDGTHGRLNNFSKNPLVQVSIEVDRTVMTTDVTDNHPYFHVEDQKYKELRDFSVGDLVKTEKGTGIITKKEVLIDGSSAPNKQVHPVYNLHMSSGPHNYLVNGAVVHNKEGGGCCFSANASVLTASGIKNIQDIRIGTEVISFDKNTKKLTTSTVGEIHRHDGTHGRLNNFSKNPLVQVSIEVDGTVMTTDVTDNHPYFHVEDQKYKELRDFSVGDLVKTEKGTGIITKKEVLIDGSSAPNKQVHPVYNLHMSSGPHNYLVNGAVVHNKG